MNRFSLFDAIRVKRPKRSNFDLSYDNKFSFNMGQLIPFYHTEVLPGDKFKINSEVFFRFAPMLAPIMHEVDCYIHYFFVPNRLLWSDWENFITGGKDGTNDISICTISTTSDSPDFPTGGLIDFLGYRNALNLHDPNVKLNRLPFSAYHLIYNEYYRDQNIQNPISLYEDKINRVVTPDNQSCQLHYRCWRKDYFTSALPWAQRGVTANIPVFGALESQDVTFSRTGSLAYAPDTDVILTPNNTSLSQSGPYDLQDSGKYLHTATLSNGQGRDFSTGISAKIESGGVEGNVSINDLRRTSALQSWLERNARSGARYVEQILAHFGVQSSDSRLQRPEYLGGGKTIVKVSEVLQQNNSSTADTPLGTMAGRAIAVGDTNNVSYYAEEHGIIMGIMSVMPKAAYYQGTHRSLLRKDKFDFYYPEFAHLGEQAILKAELYESENREDTFGYTPRYAEYKFRNDEVHGDFVNTLDFWHLGRRFTSEPNLNSTFLNCDESKDGLNRIFAVSSGNHIWCETYNHVYASRLMPEFGTPMLM